MWEVANDQLKPVSIEETLQNVNHDLYPNIALCLRILLCMPVTTSSAERAFSTMGRVKTYLRSTMTTDRLSGLGLMTIYRKKASKLDLDEVIDVFARKKDRKLELPFRVAERIEWLSTNTNSQCRNLTDLEIYNLTVKDCDKINTKQLQEEHLTYISISSHFGNLSKECRPRSDATGRDTGSRSSLFANTNFYRKKKKKKPHQTPLKLEMDTFNK